jgi:radical SAM protein with 4Fe4S-binding SPASM domain
MTLVSDTLLVRTTPAEREARELRDRALLERSLLEGRTVLETGPYEAHVGFSNVCNMSCIMCWDGSNPPPRKMTPELIAALRADVAPWLSVITPYNGSEPLIVSWEETRRVCEEHSVELSLTTNLQFLDAKRFGELRDITETLFVSVDSHVAEVFAKIRPGAKPAGIYANLRTTARLARECGLECIANIVFMTENGALMPDTVEFLADAGMESVHVLQMLDVNGRSGWSNPLVHFAPEYVAELKERCLEVARRRRLRLIWDVAGIEDHDFRERPVPRKPRKVEYDHWDWRMRNHLPGFCRNVYDRLRVDTNGSVAPCSYSTDGELELGVLGETPFAEMWNGPRMRDLRRAHYTWDYPSICSTCRFRDPVGPRDQLPFAEDVLEGLGWAKDYPERSIELLGPEHMTRHQRAPTLCFARPRAEVDRLYVVLAMGGECEELEAWEVEADAGEGEPVHFTVPPATWARLRSNVGWWWAVFGFSSTAPQTVLRSRELRCLIRHWALPRVRDSGLLYPDMGHRTVVDLGSAERPDPAAGLAQRRSGDPWEGPRRRHVRASA